LFEKAYHFVKSIALKNKLELINSLQPAKGILDIGAGTGDFICCKTKRLANHGVEADKAKVIVKKSHLWKIQPNYKTSLLT
jgi:ubiquinone/menaquinone biosynthesis C-methylase UbiE